MDEITPVKTKFRMEQWIQLILRNFQPFYMSILSLFLTTDSD